MKYVKMLGLAVMAAAALMAFVGASSASATVLCTTTEEVCAEGWDYPVGTPINASVSGTVLLKAGIEDTCTKGVANGKTANTGSETETVHGAIEELTFEECKCPATVLKKGELEIHYTEKGSGTVTGKGSEVTVNCAGVTCTYGTAVNGTDLGTLDEPEKATVDAKITINASLPKLAGGFLCANTGTWTGEYTVTSPTPLYVATKAKGQP